MRGFKTGLVPQFLHPSISPYLTSRGLTISAICFSLCGLFFHSCCPLHFVFNWSSFSGAALGNFFLVEGCAVCSQCAHSVHAVPPHPHLTFFPGFQPSLIAFREMLSETVTPPPGPAGCLFKDMLRLLTEQ